MSSSQEFLTTREFAKKAGVSTSTVSNWIRTKKIQGKKKSGQWMVPADELAKVAPSNSNQAQKPSKSPSAKASNSKANAKAYTIAEFSAMTYLTEYGVEKWLKQGRLHGAADKSGQPMVDSTSLELPDVKRLMR